MPGVLHPRGTWIPPTSRFRWRVVSAHWRQSTTVCWILQRIEGIGLDRFLAPAGSPYLEIGRLEPLRERVICLLGVVLRENL
jgi:hypothetical protein